MFNLSDEKRDELKARYGEDCRLVMTRKGPIVFRKPTAGEWDRYIDMGRAEPNRHSQHTRQLQSECVVFPDLEGYKAALEDRPGLLIRAFADAINSLIGFDDADEEANTPQKL